ncbi:MAG: DUF4190 domain-containing protein [Nocardioides sp.]
MSGPTEVTHSSLTDLAPALGAPVVASGPTSIDGVSARFGRIMLAALAASILVLVNDQVLWVLLGRPQWGGALIVYALLSLLFSASIVSAAWAILRQVAPPRSAWASGLVLAGYHGGRALKDLVTSHWYSETVGTILVVAAVAATTLLAGLLTRSLRRVLPIAAGQAVVVAALSFWPRMGVGDASGLEGGMGTVWFWSYSNATGSLLVVDLGVFVHLAIATRAVTLLLSARRAEPETLDTDVRLTQSTRPAPHTTSTSEVVGTNGFAITSLVLGIVGGSVLSLVFGFVALSQIKRSGPTTTCYCART